MPPQPPVALVVDDDPDVRTFLAFCLRSSGVACREAAGGAEAVELLTRHAAEVALAFVDQRMPGGMDGLATVAALRRVKPDLPCCLVSGDIGGVEDAARASPGVACLLGKPFTPEEVGGCVRRMLPAAGA